MVQVAFNVWDTHRVMKLNSTPATRQQLQSLQMSAVEAGLDYLEESSAVKGPAGPGISGSGHMGAVSAASSPVVFSAGSGQQR